jgi:hypothetical protein
MNHTEILILFLNFVLDFKYKIKSITIANPYQIPKIEELKQAFKIANPYNWSKKEMEIYNYVFMQYKKAQSIIDTAKMDGKKGREQSKLKEKLKIAKNILSSNVEFSIIKLTTGLSDKDLENLENLLKIKIDSLFSIFIN